MNSTIFKFFVFLPLIFNIFIYSFHIIHKWLRARSYFRSAAALSIAFRSIWLLARALQEDPENCGNF